MTHGNTKIKFMKDQGISLGGVRCPSYRSFIQDTIKDSAFRTIPPLMRNEYGTRIGLFKVQFRYLPVGVHENSKTCLVFRHPERGVTTPQDCRSLHSCFIQNEHRQAHRADNELLHRSADMRH